jgi:MFS family permease
MIVYAAQIVSKAIVMPFGGLLLTKFGPKMTLSLGLLFIVSGTVLSTNVTTLNSMVVTYGIMFGIGCGISYPSSYVCVQRFYPDQKGFVTGMVSMGYGAGALVFNPIATAFINPNNLDATIEYNDASYFDRDIASNVPNLFLLLAVCYAFLLVVGLILVKEPPTRTEAYSQLTPREESEMGLGINGVEHSSSSSISMNVNGGTLVNQNGEEIVGGGGMGRREEEGEGEGEGEGEDGVDDLSPRLLLQEPQFYLTWFIFFALGLGGVYVATNYKTMGGKRFKNDAFLSMVGSVSSVFNGGARIFWGAFADKFSYKTAMQVLSFTLGIVLFTLWPIGTALGEYGYLLWCCMTMATFGGIFSLIPSATYTYFGKKYAAANYGLVFSSQAFVSLGVSFAAEAFRPTIGYSGMLAGTAVLTWLACLGTFFIEDLPDHRRRRKSSILLSDAEVNHNDEINYDISGDKVALTTGKFADSEMNPPKTHSL